MFLHTPSSPSLSFKIIKAHSKPDNVLLLSAFKSMVQNQRMDRSISVLRGNSIPSSVTRNAASTEAGASVMSTETAETDVLKALSQIIDPDFGTDIVSCGFVKDLHIDEALGEVSFRLELTTPACPVKDMFEQRANEVVAALPWVKNVKVTMSAQPAKPIYAGELPPGLQRISNIVAVSSCKGGVGKSTVAVNLAYTLAGMGARVGIFDADVYGPSLPTMVSPENRLLEMNPETRTILPTEYLGVKLVSFGFAGQGRAIMRGPMVSGVISQLLTTAEWGELDYLVIDMPPGTGDIQLTLCQVAPLTAAVIVTTPQKLAFIDVAKGVRMFSKLKVPCVAVVENMCHFDADGKRYYPFGRGSGSQVVQQFGIPHLFDLPIRPTLSASGDSGIPEAVSDPQGEVAKTFQDLGVCVVQQCAKIRQQVSTAVTYDRTIRAIRVKVPDSDEEFLLHPATVRRNDRSAQSVDEWTGEQKLQYADIPEDIQPEEIKPMGNYAVMPPERIPRRVRSSGVNMSAKDRLDLLMLSRRTMSEIAITRPSSAAAASSAQPRFNSGPMQVKMRIPRSQIAKLMEESRNEGDVAEKIINMYLKNEVNTDGGGTGAGAGNVEAGRQPCLVSSVRENSKVHREKRVSFLPVDKGEIHLALADNQ